jgi:SecY interacting protein Syd
MTSFWQDFIQRYQNSQPCQVIYDQQWPSSCLAHHIEALIDDHVYTWQAVKRHDDNLDNIAKALEIDIPADIVEFYSSVYADHLQVTFENRQLTLLQVWNDDDFARLQENIIGHVLMKRRLKQSDTIFIGLTDDDEELISILLSSGEVVLEKLGKVPHRVVANNLSSFIAYLQLD